MSQTGSKRIRLIELEVGSLDLEYNETYAILHLPRVEKFGVKEFDLFKKYLDDLSDFFKVTKLQGPYAATSDPKVQRLVLKLGFEYLGDHDNLKVYQYNAAGTSSNRSGLDSRRDSSS